jgi:hypothetical protein
MNVLKMLSPTLCSKCRTATLCIKNSALTYGSNHNPYLLVQLCSFPYPTNSSPYSSMTNLSNISAISRPLECLGGPTKTILSFMNVFLSNYMGDLGAENIYDNQSKRPSPQILHGNKLCPSSVSDVTEFYCSSILKKYCRP